MVHYFTSEKSYFSTQNKRNSFTNEEWDSLPYLSKIICMNIICLTWVKLIICTEWDHLSYLNELRYKCNEIICRHGSQTINSKWTHFQIRVPVIQRIKRSLFYLCHKMFRWTDGRTDMGKSKCAPSPLKVEGGDKNGGKSPKVPLFTGIIQAQTVILVDPKNTINQLDGFLTWNITDMFGTTFHKLAG